MNLRTALLIFAGVYAAVPPVVSAQESAGPMTPTPRPATVASTPSAPAAPPVSKEAPEMLVVPSGTRLPLILQNAVSTRSAKPGDPVFLETTFPVTVQNRIVIPVGSYVQGEILTAKRPGKVKGTGEIRIRLNTMILQNGYTVDFNAVPTNAGTGANNATDKEGTIHGDSDKGHDVATVAGAASTGAIIGAVTSGAKGAGIGAGIGGAAGLAGVLLTRGPELQLPRGTTVDVILDRPVYLDASRVGFTDTGRVTVLPGPPSREPLRTREPF